MILILAMSSCKPAWGIITSGVKMGDGVMSVLSVLNGCFAFYPFSEGFAGSVASQDYRNYTIGTFVFYS